ncbi:MAG: hypothetical protein KC422_15395 [Trueperaceae bacterium]|nr:hypothetical protein [Trueperaceae bacterium]
MEETTNKTTNKIDKVNDEEKKEGFLTPERAKEKMKDEEFEPEDKAKS